LIDHALPVMEGATLKNFLRIDCSTRSLNLCEKSCVDHATPELFSKTLMGYIVKAPELPLPFAMEDVGNFYPSGDPFTGAEGAKLRGNPEIHHRQSRKMQDSGQPGTSSEGGTGGAWIRGNPDICRRCR
jgi:hypothetical protein